MPRGRRRKVRRRCRRPPVGAFKQRYLYFLRPVHVRVRCRPSNQGNLPQRDGPFASLFHDANSKRKRLCQGKRRQLMRLFQGLRAGGAHARQQCRYGRVAERRQKCVTKAEQGQGLPLRRGRASLCVITRKWRRPRWRLSARVHFLQQRFRSNQGVPKVGRARWGEARRRSYRCRCHQREEPRPLLRPRRTSQRESSALSQSLFDEDRLS